MMINKLTFLYFFSILFIYFTNISTATDFIDKKYNFLKGPHIENSNNTLEEIIILFFLEGNEYALEGFFDSITGDLYLKKLDLINFLEIPPQLQNKITPFSLDIYDVTYSNITSINSENIYEFREFYWDNNDYTLSIKPKWETSFEQLNKIKKNRLDLDKNTISNDNLKAITKEQWKLLTPGFFTLGYTKDNLKKSDERIYLNYSNNVLYGNFNLVSEIVNDKYIVNNFYWQKDILKNKKLLIGEYYQSKLFSLGNTPKLRGVSIGKNDSWTSTVNITSQSVKGFAPNGAIVELYENNILKSYQIVENGEYEFLINLSNGSNEYLIKQYFSDGSIKEESISLYGSDRILKKNEFDYSIEVGESEKKQAFYNIEVKYGLLENLSLTLGGFNTLSENNNISFITLGETGSFNFSKINLPILHDVDLAYKNSNEYTYKYKITTNKYGLSFSYFFENNKNISNKLLGSNYLENSDFQISTYFLGWSSRVGLNRYTNLDNLKYQEFYSNFGKNFKKIYLNLGIKEVFSSKEQNSYFNLGISHTVDHNNWISNYIDNISLNSDINYKDTSYTLSLGKSIKNSDWSYNFNISNSKKYGQNFGLLFNYTPEKIVNIQTGIYDSKNSTQRISSSIETNLYFVNNIPTIGYNDYSGNGNIQGKVFIDKNGNGIFDNDDEIVDASISTESNNKIITNNGIYGISGLQTYKESEITATLSDDFDSFFNIESEIKKFIHPNPGGQMNINFAFRPSSTVISTIKFPSDFYIEDIYNILKNIKIQFRNLSTDEVLSFNWMEDTIFIKELTVGEYEINVITDSTDLFKSNKHPYKLKVLNEETIDLYFIVENLNDGNYTLFITDNDFNLNF